MTRMLSNADVSWIRFTGSPVACWPEARPLSPDARKGLPATLPVAVLGNPQSQWNRKGIFSRSGLHSC